MMKPVLKAFGIAILVSGAAHAASVFPQSATNYIFTAPLFPASIRGEVMGDPPAYFDPRGEDLDWMWEAFVERFALINGSIPSPVTHIVPTVGKWDLSATNRFVSWSTAVDASGVTNVVVGYGIVTNAEQFSLARQDVSLLYSSLPFTVWGNTLGYATGETIGYRSHYLDGDAPLTAVARAAYDQYSVPSFTSVTFSVVGEFKETTNFNRITMPMTNGMVSVFTNRWTAQHELTVTNFYTNVVQACPLDYCHTGEGLFPGFPQAVPLKVALRRPRLNGVTAQMYAALRAAVRLADDDVAITNLAPRIVSYSHTIYEDALGRVENSSTKTNQVIGPGCSYSLSGEHQKTYTWDSEEQEYVMYPYMSVSESRTQSYEALSPTRFDSDLVTTGNVMRVSIDAAYAVVEFSYSEKCQEGEAPHQTLVVTNQVDNVVVVPVNVQSLDLSLPVSCARVWLDAKTLCASAASASGVTSLPGSAAGYSPPLGTGFSWKADCSSLVIFYSTNPTSKFSAW